jgi:Zn-dependent peptidase ImmA (M78 family)
MGYIHMRAEDLARKFRTRCPYELLDAIGAVTKVSYAYAADGLKGYCMIMNRQMFAVINGNLSEDDRRVVAGHEAAHLVLHKKDILSSPVRVLKDFALYDNSGKLEFEANTFLANFLVSDNDILESMKNPEGDFFTTAKELEIPPPLLAFKLYSMAQRGFEVKNPMNLTSKFLRNHYSAN